MVNKKMNIKFQTPKSMAGEEITSYREENLYYIKKEQGLLNF